MKKVFALILTFVLFVTFYAGCSKTKETYTIKWLNYDETVLEVDKNVAKGAMPEYNGEQPQRAKDSRYVYKFRGWTPMISAVEGDTTYIADYTPTKVLGDASGDEDWDEETLKWVADAKTKILNSDSVPGGAAINMVLDSVMSFITGVNLTTPDPLSEISDKLDNLQKSVNDGFTNVENLIMSTSAWLSADIKNAITQSERNIENMVLSQTTIANKGDSFDTLLTAINTTALSLNAIRSNSEYSSQDKALLIANLIGSYDKWSNSDNIFASYLSFLDAITKSTYSTTNDKILFDLVYEQQMLYSQFTSEALYRGAPYVEKVIYLAFYAYNICAECMLAAATVAQFTQEDKDKINPTFLDKYSTVVSPLCVVQTHIDHLNSKLMQLNFSEVSVLDRLAEYFDLDKRGGMIYYSKPGQKGIKVSSNLIVENFDPSKIKDAMAAAEDLGMFWDTGVFNDYNDSLEIVNHVKSTYNGITLRDFFKLIGYNVTNIPQGAFYMTNQEYDPPKFTYSHYFGISIDDPNYNVSKIVVYEGGNQGTNSTAVTLHTSK